MSAIGSAADMAAARTLIQVPADEVVAGDRMRDHGMMRQVVTVSASVVERSVVLFFDPQDGCGDRLRVPLLQMVSVWRVP